MAQRTLTSFFCSGESPRRDVENVPKLFFFGLKMPKVYGLGELEPIKSNPATKLIPVVILTSSLKTLRWNNVVILVQIVISSILSNLRVLRKS
jgi:response regulator RpfG family c-di-GMP phosphodiesterase